MGANLWSKAQRSRSLGKKCVIFLAYSRQKWIDLHQTKTKLISCPFYTFRRIHFTSRNASILWYLWYLSVIIVEGRMSQRSSGHVPYLLVSWIKSC